MTRPRRPRGLHAQHGEARLGVVEGDALDDAGEGFRHDGYCTQAWTETDAGRGLALVRAVYAGVCFST